MPIAHVQTVTKSGNNVTSITTDPISTTTGNGLIITLTSFGQFSTFTDTGGHSWSTALTELIGDNVTNDERCRQLYHSNITGSASHQFTFTLTGAGWPTICVTEVSGQDASDMLNIGTRGNTANDSTHTHGGLTTTAADTLLLGFGTEQADAMAYTNNDGTYTVRANVSTTSTQTGIIVATKVVSSIDTYSYSIATSPNASISMGLTAFKAGAGGGGGGTPPTLRTVRSGLRW